MQKHKKKSVTFGYKNQSLLKINVQIWKLLLKLLVFNGYWKLAIYLLQPNLLWLKELHLIFFTCKLFVQLSFLQMSSCSWFQLFEKFIWAESVVKVTRDTNKPTKSSQCNSNVATCGKSRLCFNQVIQPFNQQLHFHETSEAFYISSGSSLNSWFFSSIFYFEGNSHFKIFLSLYISTLPVLIFYTIHHVKSYFIVHSLHRMFNQYCARQFFIHFGVNLWWYRGEVWYWIW